MTMKIATTLLLGAAVLVGAGAVSMAQPAVPAAPSKAGKQTLAANPPAKTAPRPAAKAPDAAPTTIGLPSREQVNAQADLNLWGNWQVFAAAQRR